jgi:hypothetical protein
MPVLDIFQDSEQPSFPLRGELLIGQGELTAIGLLRHGTKGGKATVSMVITLRDGKQVFAETTWALFQTAATALAASPIAIEEATFGA